MNRKPIRYYQSDDDKLYQFNHETSVYKLRNTIQKIDTRISKEEFLDLKCKEIKRDEFSRLMNLFFNNIKHVWEYENSKFKKLPNFESSEHSLSTNYQIGKEVPLHELDFHKNCIIVYHWGKVYYHTISYNGYKQGQLIDPKTKNLVRWAQLKHCAPIINLETEKII